MHKIFLACDNGVTGSISIINSIDSSSLFVKTPAKVEQSYTKKKQNISRIDWLALDDLLLQYRNRQDTIVILERPMTNAMRVMATISGARAFESTVCCVERAGLGYEVVDSKQWQSVMLPSGVKKDQLKKTSADLGIRLFPHLQSIITKHGDADSLLMAEWARRINL